jgi:hypothetical protein
MKVLYITIILFAVVLSSCKKEENSSIKDINDQYKKLLSDKPWKLAVTDRNPATTPTNYQVRYYAAKVCELDDLLEFYNNGLSLIKREGASSCDASTEAVKGLNYAADFSKQTIIINSEEFKIAELSETQMKLYRPVSVFTGFANIIYVYEH